MWRDLSFWGTWLGTLLLIYSLGVCLVYIGLALLAFIEARLQRRRARTADRLSLFESDLAPSISILVPAFNEEPTIVDSVRSLMQLEYPSFEIVVVNDGSTDHTLDRMTRAFNLRPSRRTLRARVPRERVRGVYSSPDYPFLVVLDVVNGGGKARAVNIALAFSRHPLILVVDADSVLERDTLLQLALPFYEDASVLAVGGVVRPVNGCILEHGRVVDCTLPRSQIARYQVVEYLRSMLTGRLGWTLLDSLFIISGALGLFSREAVLAVGGYRDGSMGEDMDLCMRLQRWAARNQRRLAIRFIGGAVGWTEVPETLKVLSKQRSRWHQGLAEALWYNRELLFNQRFALHHGIAFVFQLTVEFIGPVVEVAGQLVLLALAIAGKVDLVFCVIYFSIFVVGGTLPTLLAIVLERAACPRFRRRRDLEGLALYALFENFGYRQLTAWWRVMGLVNTLRGRRTWGEISRRGAQPAQIETSESRAA